MNFFRKICFFAPIGLIVFGISTHIFLRSRAPTEPIKIYKATQPTPKLRPLQTDTAATQSTTPPEHSHDPPQEQGSHDHATVSTEKSEKYDWRDDPAFDDTLVKNDPWKQTYLEHTATEDTDDTYPPKEWYKTEDLVLRAEYYGAQMLKQFGETPEVRTVSDWEVKKAMEITPTHDELITYLEALYHLFPREATLQALNYHRELRAKGVEIKMIPEGNLR